MKEDPTLNLIFTNHLKRAFGLLRRGRPKTTSLTQLNHRVETIVDPRHARLKLKELAKKTGTVAFDYETTGLKPDIKKHKIVTCSFCFNGNTFAFPFSGQEKWVSYILRNPDLGKVASNLKFEERWTQAKLGHGVNNWNWDTMLAAHVLDNRPAITSIKFLCFVLLGIPNYDEHIEPFLKAKESNGFNRIHDIQEKDLLLYNGIDSLVEYMVMEKQKRSMGVMS